MSPARRAALYGAGIGVIVGFLRLQIGDSSPPNPYIPQTTFGVVAEHFGYAIPWAAIGGLIGYAIGRRKRASGPSPDPVMVSAGPTIPREPTTALQRLGHVLGWTGNILAVLLIAAGLYGFTNDGGDAFVKGLAFVAGVTAFLIGRALRYIFAGATA